MPININSVTTKIWDTLISTVVDKLFIYGWWPFVSSRLSESLVLAADLFTMFPSFLKGFPAIGMSGLGPIPGHPATQSWTNTAGWPFIFPGKVSILPGYWSGSDSACQI